MDERPPVCYVEWVDAGIVASTWTPREEVVGERLDEIQGVIRSAGFLIHRDDRGLIVSLSMNENNDDVNLSMFIPNGSIRRLDIWAPWL